MRAEQESQLLVQNVIRHSLASISFLRDLFDEKNFSSSLMLGLTTKLLEPMDEGARSLDEWFEANIPAALQKAYLKKLCMSICRDATGLDMIEQYEFLVDYKDCVLENSQELIQQKCRQTLKTLLQMTENLAALPAERYIAMRVRYTADCPTDGLSGHVSDEPKDAGLMEIGTIETTCHKLTIRLLGRDVNPLVAKVVEPIQPQAFSTLYRSGVKPTLQPSSMPAKHEKYETHGKLYKHPRIAQPSAQEEVEKVFLTSRDEKVTLTGSELLQILHNDAEKFGETRLGSLVKRSPMAGLTKRMMMGTKEASCAVFTYSALERLVQMGLVKLIPVDNNGKATDIENRPHLYDQQGNLKSDLTVKLTPLGRQFITTSRKSEKRDKDRKKDKKEKRKKEKKEKNQLKRKRETLIDVEADPNELKKFKVEDDPLPRQCRFQLVNYQ